MVRRLRKVAPQVLLLGLVATVCWVVGSVAGRTNDLLAASEPTLAGKWTLNQSQSDDSAEKVHAAEKNASSGRRTSGGRPTDEPGVGGPVEHGPLDTGPFGGVWGRAPVGADPWAVDPWVAAPWAVDPWVAGVADARDASIRGEHRTLRDSPPRPRG